ncbi:MULTISPECIES: hypothetical protein [unclassified Pseudodesulfovibrio]|uniref:hypothetical protein n=1 Tax=unclassified Pseudodesulfovibrio TaxID=2661612 RepID=UPI000FEC1946|nr:MULTISPECIES: hypothetical protein [unclassified Pseudodesulfovibrio]MCJ2164678.1 hypothetical protein [Pseudodesulfovibrio sp. S3-i]RWU04130.1 hypothetical protein DWB63_08985 [Pseudodesulfovibrio sp. S3]
MCILRTLKYLALLGILSLLLFIQISPTDPYVVISATTEVLTYRVSRAEVAAIPLIEAQVRSTDAGFTTLKDEEGRPLFTGLLEPTKDSIVCYRYADGRVSIVVDGGDKSAGTVKLPDGRQHELSTRAMFVVNMSQGTLQRLPIAGPTEIGQEYGVQAVPQGKGAFSRPIMSKGNINVFGRGRFWPYKNDLYPVPGGNIPLPAGGRLSSGDTLIPHSPTAASPWFGIAQITPEGFDISATTVSSNLRLYRMGSTGESETFALSVLTQAISDPVFQWVVLFFGTLQVLISMWGSRSRRKRETFDNVKNILKPFTQHLRRLFQLR